MLKFILKARQAHSKKKRKLHGDEAIKEPKIAQEHFERKKKLPKDDPKSWFKKRRKWTIEHVKIASQ